MKHAHSNDFWLLVLFLSILFFHGDPDLHDELMSWLRRTLT